MVFSWPKPQRVSRTGSWTMNRGRWNGYSFWIDLQFYILVGDIPIPLNNIWKSLGMIIPNIWKNKKCSKPPTSIIQLDIGESDNAEQEKSWSRSSTEPTAVDVSWCMYLTWGPSIFCRSLSNFGRGITRWTLLWPAVLVELVTEAGHDAAHAAQGTIRWIVPGDRQVRCAI